MEKIKGHVHAEIMAEYAEVAKTNPEPWKEFQYYAQNDEYWDSLSTHPAWSTELEYRRKPKTFRIGEYDVPEPSMARPKYGDKYYCISFGPKFYAEPEWRNDYFDEHTLESGYIHATKENAILHTKAILSLIEADKKD